MNCQWVQQNLSAYIDNELPQNQKEMVESHLSWCSRCKTELESVSCAWDILSSWEDELPPLHLKDNILRAVKKEKRFNFMRILLPVAAVFVIAISIMFVYKPGDYYEKQAVVTDQEEIQQPLTVESAMIDEDEIIKNLQLLEEKEFLDSVEVLKTIDYLPLVEENVDNRSSMGYYST
jgi:uncharacterized protein with NAD-binding domain and iron-sulfur cluster